MIQCKSHKHKFFSQCKTENITNFVSLNIWYVFYLLLCIKYVFISSHCVLVYNLTVSQLHCNWGHKSFQTRVPRQNCNYGHKNYVFLLFVLKFCSLLKAHFNSPPHEGRLQNNTSLAWSCTASKSDKQYIPSLCQYDWSVMHEIRIISTTCYDTSVSKVRSSVHIRTSLPRLLSSHQPLGVAQDPLIF